MDSARKINKSKSLHSKINRNSSKIVIKNSNVKTHEEIEDHRLKNWKKWLENREKTCDRLKTLTGRKSEDLLINSYEKIRPKIEIQNLLEVAALSVIPEKSKDEINFWTTPVYLKNRRDPENPEIAVCLTKKNLKIPRSLSRVFLPELTQKEKCLNLPKTPVLPKHNDYLRKKLKELSPQISKLNLKISEIDRVAVEGRKIPDKQRIILKINQEEIIIDEDSTKNPELIFSLDFFSKKGERSKRSICLDNKTFNNLTYEWQEPVPDHHELSRTKTKNLFHFERPSDTILPGRYGELIIWYDPSSPGAHLESIILETSPRISPSPIVISLWGVCEEPSRFPNKLINYEDYLNLRFRNSVISEIIEDLWDRVESPPPQLPSYSLYFLESEVFADKNPGFAYNHEIVGELKGMFEDLGMGDSWALSLSELQYHVLHVDDGDLRSGMLNKFMRLCRELRKPSRWEVSRDSKYQVVYNLISSFVGEFLMESEYIKSYCRWGEWSGCMLEGDRDDSSGFEGCESSGRRGWNRMSRSSGSVLSDIEEYWDTGGQEEIYDAELYYEIFYVRIHHLLGETVEKISAAVDGIEHLSQGDFFNLGRIV